MTELVPAFCVALLFYFRQGEDAVAAVSTNKRAIISKLEWSSQIIISS